MKPYGLTARLIRAVLLGVALGTVLLVTAEGAFTEFYMQSGGSNLNAGSTTNNTAAYTSTSGNWVQSTRVFTPTDGINPSTNVHVGDFASVFLNAASVGVYIGRVSAVTNAVNGTITIDGTANYGSAPSNSTGGMSIKVGGAWLGPNGAVTFPFGLSGGISVLLDTNGDRVRVNAKNDQTYTMTANLAFTSLGSATLQGYSSSVGDLGKATFTSNITSGNNFTIGANGTCALIDLIFASTGSTSANHTFDVSSGQIFLRCVFHGARGSGLNLSGSGTLLVLESEAYDCNKSNTANDGGFSTSTNTIGLGLICIGCYSHDHTGSNAHCYASGSNANGILLINSIADSCGGNGLNFAGNSAAAGIVSINSNYYNNTGDGIKFANTTQGLFAYLANNNFLKNGGKAINNTLTAQTGILYNNGRGSGTQANGSSDVLGSIVDSGTDVTYASNITPWKAPLTGDFSTVWTQSTAAGAGRGVFTETGSGITPTPTPTASGTPTPKTGTVGFPDIGAAQAATPTATPSATVTPTVTPTATETPTPTATATASFTPCSSVAPTPTATPTAPIEVSYGFSQ